MKLDTGCQPSRRGGTARARRGPVPPVAEDGLLAAIQADLAASPFRGEGHRKVWARLLYGPVWWSAATGCCDSCTRTNYSRPIDTRRILTTAPDRLWGTDASMVQTVQDGRVWVFAALDHFNSEVVGHYGHRSLARRRNP
jgi:putative transposase